MSLAIVNSRAQVGIHAPAIRVEVHLAGGLPTMSIVGLPETAVKESKDRVRAALQNSGFDVPARRITISLAPADLPKEGSRFDLAIALGILAASRQINAEALQDYEFLGELSLSGDLHPVSGILPAAMAAKDAVHKLIVPADNASESALVNDVESFSASSLLSVCMHLSQRELLPVCVQRAKPQHPSPNQLDMADIRGQYQARRALEVAAAGGHNLLMVGPPGSGKTMLASRLPGILPPMSESEALQSAAVASITGQNLCPATWRQRRFRAPHHTSSGVALVGGGSHPRPGEISLAHNGVLFLDELPEFDRKVLDVLREPLESGSIIISRAARQAEFPAQFQLIAAMNPCPLGGCDLTNGDTCRCTPDQVARYRGKVSGPLLDRIDIQIEVPRIPPAILHEHQRGEASAKIQKRVTAAQQQQYQRTGCTNSLLNSRQIEQHCQLKQSDSELLEHACEKLKLSARAWYRIVKVARTIADLTCSDRIERDHLTEAIGYRRLNLH